MVFYKKNQPPQGQSTKEAARQIAKSAAGPSAAPETKTSEALQPRDFTHSTAHGIESALMVYKDQIQKILQNPRVAESLVVTFSTIIARNPDLKKCTAKSLMGSFIQAAILRLNIEPAIGHVYLIPRKNKNNQNEYEATFNIGYKGYISLGYRNTDVAKIVAKAVRKNDFFEYVEGTNASLKHIPPALGVNRGELVGAYSFVQFKSGAIIYHVMDREEVMKHKNFSQAKNSEYSPWNARVISGSDEGDWEASMWAKTAFRALANQTPISIDVTAGVASDEKTIQPEMFKGGKLDLAELEDFEPAPQLDPSKEVKTEAAGAEPKAAPQASPSAGSSGATGEKKEEPGPKADPSPSVQAGPPDSEELRPPIPPPDTPQGQLEEKLCEVQRKLKIVRPYLAEKLHRLGLNITIPVPDDKVPLAIKMCDSLIQMHEEKK